MTDYAGFRWGAATFPLATNTSNSALYDADKAVFYLLEFYANVLARHLGPRLMAEAAAGNIDRIETAVAETIPLNPEHFLTEEHLKFPLLAAHRKSSKFDTVGGADHSFDAVEVAFVLPPMQAGEAERAVPLLTAAAHVLVNRTQQGMDPLYTPTGGTAGAHVWETAGVVGARVKSASYGAYSITEGLYFPAVVLEVELTEKSDYYYDELDSFAGENVHIDIADPVQETTVSNVVEFNNYPAPTLTAVSPTSGTKQGGTLVTLTGSGFRTGTTPTVLFGGLAATSVVVVSATSATCVTPAHDAYDTFAADVKFTNTDGQSDTLEAAYTFTSP